MRVDGRHGSVSSGGDGSFSSVGAPRDVPRGKPAGIPFLEYLMPQALHSVLTPEGPLLHSGDSVRPQNSHRTSVLFDGLYKLFCSTRNQGSVFGDENGESGMGGGLAFFFFFLSSPSPSSVFLRLIMGLFCTSFFLTFLGS